jgi:membrane dipeptidase
MLHDIEKDLWDNPVKRKQAMAELGNQLQTRMADIHIGIETIVDHIEYIIELVGDDHVGFGSDFDGLPALPVGVAGCDIYPAIIDALKRRGFSQITLDKISAQNFIRVLEAND